MRIYLVIIATLFLFLPFSLKANDTAATIGAGGIINYEKSNDISMDYEVLKISTQKINITYDFTNHSSNDITTKVAFPLPPSPLVIGDTSNVFTSWDDLYQAYTFLDEAKKSINKLDYAPSTLLEKVKGNPFTDFTRTVNGTEGSYRFVAHAIDPSGKDITNFLIKNNIPLSSAYLGGLMEEGAIHNNPALKEKLSKLGLINEQGHVLWQLQISYIWDEIFPANKTIRINHSYTPRVGYHWVSGKNPESLNDITFTHRDYIAGKMEQKKLADFCIADSDKTKILEMFDKDNAIHNNAYIANDDVITYRTREVRYILSTGANWKGPIKKFRLEIIPPTPTSIVSSCIEGGLKKTKEGTYVSEIENFTPKSDLKILFIDPVNLE